MFELHGYWQKVGGMAEAEVWQNSCRRVIRTQGEARLSPVRAMEKYLSVPTFIRLGRKINGMCGVA